MTRTPYKSKYLTGVFFTVSEGESIAIMVENMTADRQA